MGKGTVPSKLLLVNHCSPGDVLMLTAAVRDLHRAYPGEYLTGVDTYCPDLWQNNPHVVPLDPSGRGVLRIDCNHPPLLDRSNGQPRHYVESMHDLLATTLGRPVPLTRFAPDLYLSDEETAVPPIGQSGGPEIPRPYWLMVAGGKRDLTTKWWPTAYWQRVVDHFAGKVHFVQAGAGGDHHHPPLRGVTNLVGRTTLREFVRLVYHAEGVVCPVTSAMHLAAAFDRPCVVPAGGREPPHWEMYPAHQFLHTVGQLPCCADRGCWKARVVPLGDGDADRDRNLCLRPVKQDGEDAAECLAMIEPADVCRAIDRYRRHPRTPSAAAAGEGGVMLTETTARAALDAAARSLPPYPGGFEGRGVVIPGGGPRYFPCVFVCARMLRQVGCDLPIEVWHLGPAEMTGDMRAALEPMGVRCVDALDVRRRHPARILNGWELKAYAILYSRFREVLLLDADNVPVRDPAFLFDAPQYLEHGAVFWPDFERYAPGRDIWRLTGVPYRDEPEMESGQVLVDKRRCWEPAQLAMWINEHSDFWYRFVYGDKDTFRFAWHKLGRPFARPARPPVSLDALTIVQFDFDGRRLFQHRNRAKWKADGTPQRRVPDFWLEDDCLRHLNDLIRGSTAGRAVRYDDARATPDERRAAADLCGRRWIYRRVGHDERPMAFNPDGSVGEGSAACEQTWNLWADAGDGGGLSLAVYGRDGLTCRLSTGPAGAGAGSWRGRWLVHEQMPVELVELTT